MRTKRGNETDGRRTRRRYLVVAMMMTLLLVGAAAFRLSRPAGPSAATQAAERAATPTGMIYVPGGFFWSGTDDEEADDEVKPQRRVFVPSFYLDRTEVTNQEYRRFRPEYIYPASEDALPVTNVTYAQADAYAKWAGKMIPTEAQWEKAARGTDGRRYPWGDTWDKTRVARRARPAGTVAGPEPQSKTANSCRLGPSRVRPVGSVASGISPYGCLDMAGNAWEWVQGYYQNNPDQRILRGGAVGYGERACRTYERGIEGAGAT